MLLTGGVTVDGNLWDRSRIDLPNTNPPVIQLYAPSYDITVADAGTGFRQADGVSYGRQCCPVLMSYLDASTKDFTDLRNNSCRNNLWTRHILPRTFQPLDESRQ